MSDAPQAVTPSQPPPGNSPSGAPEGGGPPDTGRRDAIRFAVLFVVLFGGLYGAFAYWDVAREYVVDPWTRFVATTARWALLPFQEGLQHDGNFLFVRGYGIEIIDGCNGITPLSLLVAGVLAFPTTWRARAVGLLIGVPVVVVVNLVRIAALWFLGLHYPDWFDRSHIYIAQAFVILATGGFWLWWLGRFAAPTGPPPPDRPTGGGAPGSGDATAAHHAST